MSRLDLPGGMGRLCAGSTGMDHVLVNGRSIVRNGRLVGSSTRQIVALRARHDDPFTCLTARSVHRGRGGVTSLPVRSRSRLV